MGCVKAKVTFQMDSSGSWQYRPEVEVDPNTSVRMYKRFKYFIKPAGVEALKKAVLPSDDFMRGAGQIEVLAELKKAAEAKTEKSSG